VRLVLPSQCVPRRGPGRKAVRKAVWPPKPTANQEAGMFVPSLFSRLSSFHLMWTGCGA